MGVDVAPRRRNHEVEAVRRCCGGDHRRGGTRWRGAGDAGIGIPGVTVAKGTFGNVFSLVHTKSPAWTELMVTHGDTDLYVQANTWQPGGTTGWHTHPGPSFVIVTAGSVTQYEADGGKCEKHVYSMGDSFVDPGDGHVHLLRNETATVATTTAVQFVPATAARRIEVPAVPAPCAGIQ